MIEKLNIGYIDESIIGFKINELVDAVNGIVSVQEKLIDSRFVVETKHAEPDGDDAIQEVIHADPYAEQEKWIGKLCGFRDKDYKDGQWDYGLLQAVENAETALVWKTGRFKHNLGHWYDFCEPVKPDDVIIYKGE